jgi:hypothetical protein
MVMTTEMFGEAHYPVVVINHQMSSVVATSLREYVGYWRQTRRPPRRLGFDPWNTEKFSFFVNLNQLLSLVRVADEEKTYQRRSRVDGRMAREVNSGEEGYGNA